ncbi:NfeD family protein [Phormidesmis priestleyi]|uniref:NfeD family protein n=1 Tax=Phormidesmis priestleyi TaxID=268141 RepID=UPI00083A4CE2|nr:NfeD family protein [Phormidesmis priestleyi]
MSLTPAMIWLLAGVVLCLIEFVLPTAFVAFVMGLSALIVAAVSAVLPLNAQIILWMALSAVMVLGSRRFINRKAALKLDATEAETLTEILPGKPGRVLYEGNSWSARCETFDGAIAPHQKVYIVGRKGTTLIVVPEGLAQES